MISTDKEWYKSIMLQNEQALEQLCQEESAIQVMNILFYTNGRTSQELFDKTMDLIQLSTPFAKFLAKTNTFQTFLHDFKDFINNNSHRQIYCNIMNKIVPRIAEVEPEYVEPFADDLYSIPECTPTLMILIKYYNKYSHATQENLEKWISGVDLYDAVAKLLSCYEALQRKGIKLDIPEEWLFKTYYTAIPAIKLSALKLCKVAFPERVREEYENMLKVIPKGGYIASILIDFMKIPPSNAIDIILANSTTSMARAAIMNTIALSKEDIEVLAQHINDVSFVAVKRAIHPESKLSEPTRLAPIECTHTHNCLMPKMIRAPKKPATKMNLVRFGTNTWISLENIQTL